MVRSFVPPYEELTTCPRCELKMTPGVACCECAWKQDGKVIPAITFGLETPPPPGRNCGDCGTPRGATHHYGCAWEECPHGRQALTCDECPVLEHDPYTPSAPLVN